MLGSVALRLAGFLGPYQTPKLVRFHDPTLTLTYYCLSLILVGVVVLQLFVLNEYVEMEPAVSSFTFWGAQPRPPIPLPEFCSPGANRDNFMAGGQCEGKPDDFVFTTSESCLGMPCTCGVLRRFTGDIIFVRPVCEPFSRDRHSVDGSATELFVITHRELTPYICNRSDPQVLGTRSCDTRLLNSSFQRSLIIADAARSTYNMYHVLRTSFGDFLNPETIIRNSEGEIVRRVPPNHPILDLSFGDFLAYANASLSDALVQPGMRVMSHLPGFSTGIHITATVEYSNYRPYDTSNDLKAVITFEADKNQWGIRGRTNIDNSFAPNGDPLSGVSTFDMGIRVDFVTIGTVGKVSFTKGISSLVSALVLLGLATTITDLLATYVIPLRKSFFVGKADNKGRLQDIHDSGDCEKWDASLQHQIKSKHAADLLLRRATEPRPRRRVSNPITRAIRASFSSRQGRTVILSTGPTGVELTPSSAADATAKTEE